MGLDSKEYSAKNAFIEQQRVWSWGFPSVAFSFFAALEVQLL